MFHASDDTLRKQYAFILMLLLYLCKWHRWVHFTVHQVSNMSRLSLHDFESDPDMEPYNEPLMIPYVSMP